MRQRQPDDEDQWRIHQLKFKRTRKCRLLCRVQYLFHHYHFNNKNKQSRNKGETIWKGLCGVILPLVQISMAVGQTATATAQHDEEEEQAPSSSKKQELSSLFLLLDDGASSSSGSGSNSGGENVLLDVLLDAVFDSSSEVAGSTANVDSSTTTTSPWLSVVLEWILQPQATTTMNRAAASAAVQLLSWEIRCKSLLRLHQQTVVTTTTSSSEAQNNMMLETL
jgi:hypothetical protein